MRPRLTDFHRLAVPAALIAAGLAFGAGGARADDDDRRRGIDVSIHKGTLEIIGSSSADALALRLKAGKPEKLEIDAGDDGKADFRVKRRKFERIGIELRGGADSVRIDESNGAFTDTMPTTLDGGADDDTLRGGRGAEVLIAGDGNDAVDGNQGNDVAFLGAGDDRFTWDPGDGSDVVEGQSGDDELDFNGSGASEAFDASANGERARFTRNVGNIVMDLDDVEKIDTDALGGADTYNAGDLSGTDVTELDTDLAGALGGATADGEADTVTLAGSNDRDFAEAFGNAESTAVVGLPTFARVRHSEPADRLAVNALGGDDSVSATSLPAEAAGLVVDGGNGGDTIFGGRGRDVLLGGADGDFVDGNQGDDVALLGGDRDIFRWDPGDGSDVVEGQSGSDVMLFNGSGANEVFDVSANGQRVRFTRNVGNIVMDVDGVEKIETLALGGADEFTANDLSGTAVGALAVNVGAVLGSPATDAQPDNVIVNGTNGDDAIAVAGSAGSVNVTGLAASVAITRAEAALDRLTVNGLGGADTLDDSGLAPNTIGLSFTQ